MRLKDNDAKKWHAIKTYESKDHLTWHRRANACARNRFISLLKKGGYKYNTMIQIIYM